MGTATPERPPPVRWWPLAPIISLIAIALVWIWTSFGEQRQSRVLATVATAGLGSILILFWLIFLSRVRPRTRLLVVAGVAMVLVTLALSVERRGVSGDVVPLLAWRWSSSGPGEARPEGSADPDSENLVSWGSYPQFLGPRRDATLSADGLDPDWSDWDRHPPRELWRREVGSGWSGFAVSGPYAVTQEQRDAQELVTCYDRITGRLLWVREDPARHEDAFAGAGPRATPAIVGDRVFSLGATGRLNALDLATGELLWTADVMTDAVATPPPYGVAASPLVIDGKVVVAAGGSGGGSLLAYDEADGSRIWGGGEAPAAYSSPLRVRLAGVDQIVWLNESNVAAHDPSDGQVLWAAPWPSGTERVAQPVVVGSDGLFVSTGYGVGAKLFRIEAQPDGGLRARVDWESRSLKSKFANVVLFGGHLYGLDDGIMVCVDATDGSRVWKGGRYGHGQLIRVGDVLLVQAESGDVVLVRATPDGHRELGRISALARKTWNHPALAGSHLLVRNDREAACYELGPRNDENRIETN